MSLTSLLEGRQTGWRILCYDMLRYIGPSTQSRHLHSQRDYQLAWILPAEEQALRLPWGDTCGESHAGLY